jgi:hypothetical protein
MNHHADKLLLDTFETEPGADSQLIKAYSCPHCGANAGMVVEAN